MIRLVIRPYGDSAVLAGATGGTAEQRWCGVHGLAAPAARLAGVSDVVATYDSLLVEFDCGTTTFEDVAAGVRAARPEPLAAAPVTFHLPAVYDGPDLDGVASRLGLPAVEVVRRHATTPWLVRFLGAPAGAPMLDGPAFPVPVNRRPRPRVRVPAGSVAVAGRQSVIYPVPSPGGWQLIGRTPVRVLSLALHPGDVIRFDVR